MVRTRDKLEGLHDFLDREGIVGGNGPKPSKALDEFDAYIVVNQPLIPNYGERWRNEEAIATGFVESAVNQVVNKRFVKKQQMQWTKKGPICCCKRAPNLGNRQGAAERDFISNFNGLKPDPLVFRVLHRDHESPPEPTAPRLPRLSQGATP